MRDEPDPWRDGKSLVKRPKKGSGERLCYHCLKVCRPNERHCRGCGRLTRLWDVSTVPRGRFVKDMERLLKNRDSLPKMMLQVPLKQ